jgi:hypothetical protein
MNSAIRGIISALVLCVSLPIFLFLLHFVVAASHPDRLVWFLFWIYVPVHTLIAFCMRLLDRSHLDERFDEWAKKRGAR